MVNDIKLKISLESNAASIEIKKLDEQVSNLIKKLTSPLKTGINPPDEETISKYRNLKLVVKEFQDAFNRPIQFPNYFPQPLSIKGKTPDDEKIPQEGELFNRKNRYPVEEFLSNQKKMTDIEKKYSAQRLKIYSDEYLYKVAVMESMLFSAAELYGKQTVLFKTLSMAEAVISTYNAANAALLPPPVGAGPILGEIQAGLVILNGLKRVEKIAATQIPGYAKGGIVIGEKGPEVIENMQDYAAGRAELIQKTIIALQKEIGGSGYSNELIGEIKNLRTDIKAILSRPALALLDDRQAKKIYYRGNYIARKTR